MAEIKFTTSLEHNIQVLKEIFKNDNTFITRMAKNKNGLTCAVCFFDGMVNNLAINQSIIRPIVSCYENKVTAETLAETIIQINDSIVQPDLNKMLSAMMYGDTVILTEGEDKPVVVNTKGFSVRSSSEPDNERVLRGPREGFTEAFMINLSMIRRRLNDTRLKFSFSRMATHSQTAVCLCYLEGVTDEKLVKEIKKRLDSIDLDGILDANYIAECIRDEQNSPFPTLGTTERPDVVVAKLLEGRVAIITDGTPVVLTAPCILQECIQANDDYYLPVMQASLARIIRSCGIMLSIIIPALYVALLYYHAELLPTRMLLALAAAQKGVPLPPLWEIFTLLIVFEILKEAGTRTPGVIGSTMSIVGGLVLGQSAVSARLISAPAVIIVAIAAVTGLAAPKLQNAALYLRFILLICSALFGLYGLVLGLSSVLLHLCALHSCSMPYLLNLLPRVNAHTEDRAMRISWRKMKNKRFIAGRSKK